MPKIEIDTCPQTPNYCALEAIAKAMLDNRMRSKGGQYQHESLIEVKSGRLLKVTETPVDMSSTSPCNCKYRVEKVEV